MKCFGVIHLYDSLEIFGLEGSKTKSETQNNWKTEKKRKIDSIRIFCTYFFFFCDMKKCFGFWG